MARIEVESTTKVVLHRALIKQMSKVLDKFPEESWVRLVIVGDGCETFETSMTAYIQGPNGEEKEIYKVIE